MPPLPFAGERRYAACATAALRQDELSLVARSESRPEAAGDARATGGPPPITSGPGDGSVGDVLLERPRSLSGQCAQRGESRVPVVTRAARR